MARFIKIKNSGDPSLNGHYRCQDCEPGEDGKQPVVKFEDLHLHHYIFHMVAPMLEAADEIANMPYVCPECKVGKHGNCNGDGGFDSEDKMVPCACNEGEHPGRRDSTA